MEKHQVQQRGSAEGFKLNLKLYVNNFYYSTMGQRQARLRQVRDNWMYNDRRIPITWEMVPFKGGPFDRDYFTITQQYIPPAQTNQAPQVPVEQTQTVPETTEENEPAKEPLSDRVLRSIVDIASKEVGVTEDPPGSNKGPRINQYLESIGLKPGLPWSVAFIYWVYRQAGAANKLRKTGSVMQLWNGINPAERISQKEAMANPQLVKPGNLFFIQLGRTGGHIGIVERVQGETIFTIEGNSNDKGSEEGTGVIRGVRQISSATLGFSNFGGRNLPAQKY
jgi:hypothetical protein